MNKVLMLAVMAFCLMFAAVPAHAQEALSAAEDSSMVDADYDMMEDYGEGVITGKVIMLDLACKAVTVKTDSGIDSKFNILDGETILWKGVEDIEITDIREGDDVEVGYYTDESNNLIASWVDILIEEALVPMQEY